MPISAPNRRPESFHCPERSHRSESAVAPAPGCEPCSAAACTAAAWGQHRAAFPAAHRRGGLAESEQHCSGDLRLIERVIRWL